MTRPIPWMVLSCQQPSTGFCPDITNCLRLKFERNTRPIWSMLRRAALYPEWLLAVDGFQYTHPERTVQAFHLLRRPVGGTGVTGNPKQYLPSPPGIRICELEQALLTDLTEYAGTTARYGVIHHYCAYPPSMNHREFWAVVVDALGAKRLWDGIVEVLIYKRRSSSY
ncbi:uncharacterized protein EI97DRAFT_434614 [Westerdykella ornata]|uniref:Uncharacterized protein n=1 Tax=Westerdykella ornata TaxID=318751 RepID=A0A6A6JEK3_WESOR|nr:uncharacterized protein EI97DRAFT_434614 [Westerdykella ornata]KAF2275050.1 hypothetical protein EI97DRAFT_434614 [Westerdykella ornata]